MSTVVAPAPLKLARLRTPIVLIAIGCVIALVAFGPRSTLGQFLSPLSFDRGWGREAFSLAIAIQNLLWGAAQPFAGAVADRFGPMWVLCFGAILYATGLAWMAQATTLVELNLSAGVLIGFGLAGCSFPMVIGALGKLVPENWRGFAFGAGTAAGSFGQFLYSPLAAALIHAFSWQTTLLVFAGTILLVLPLSLARDTLRVNAQNGGPLSGLPVSLPSICARYAVPGLLPGWAGARRRALPQKRMVGSLPRRCALTPQRRERVPSRARHGNVRLARRVH